jgi:hypothetical protein
MSPPLALLSDGMGLLPLTAISDSMCRTFAYLSLVLLFARLAIGSDWSMAVMVAYRICSLSIIDNMGAGF